MPVARARHSSTAGGAGAGANGGGSAVAIASADDTTIDPHEDFETDTEGTYVTTAYHRQQQALSARNILRYVLAALALLTIVYTVNTKSSVTSADHSQQNSNAASSALKQGLARRAKAVRAAAESAAAAAAETRSVESAGERERDRVARRRAGVRARHHASAAPAAAAAAALATTTSVPAHAEEEEEEEEKATQQEEGDSSSSESVTDAAATTSAAALQPQRRTKPPKQQIDHELTKDELLSILQQLHVPRTPTYASAHIKRILVNKNDPSNKYLPHPRQGVMDALPLKDLAEGMYKRCAVVGNSGVLLQREDGAAIDAHDAIFRFNDGPTDGFEKYAGSRTTHRFLNNNWSRSWLKHRARGAHEDHVVLFGMGAARFIEGLHARYPTTPVLFVAPEFAGNARGMYKKSYLLMEEANMLSVRGRNSPPTGIEGVFLAISVCDEVNVYGFQVNPNPDIPYHYHDKVHGVEAAHSFTFQAVFLRMIAAGGSFRLCVPGEEMYDSAECVAPVVSESS
ncbi:sialyltransferase [Pycnococcus provasolii]